MPFVKLDCGILNSTLWFERNARELFLTALLMAEPFELQEPAEQMEVHSLQYTGFVVPPGWYGFVPAAGIGIIHRAGVDEAVGLAALHQLGSPEASSRSQEFDGRRLVRINGGFIVLNFMRYRDRDYGAAERMRRLRARRKVTQDVTANTEALHRNVTQAESRVQRTEAETDVPKINPPRIRSDDGFKGFWDAYPRHVGKASALKAWAEVSGANHAVILAALEVHKTSLPWTKDGGQFIPHPATWLNGRRWEDEVEAAPRPKSLGPDYGAYTDWREECARLHGGRCSNVTFHAAKVIDV